jgi:tRNA pseudouridine65 synthase
MDFKLQILFQDDHLIAIHKPNGLLVHRSKIAKDADVFALQLLRDQIGQKVYPAHRLDRKTSGVLLFSLDQETNSKMQQMFAEGRVAKKYLAIVRGFTNDAGLIDYPLKKDDDTLQEARTSYKTLMQSEIDIPFGKHPSSRYSLLEVSPETGRMHQIRKHLAHIFHPIIGDRPHGCNKQNRFFKEKWAMETMLLHASQIQFRHPQSGDEILIRSKAEGEFLRMLGVLGLGQGYGL